MPTNVLIDTTKEYDENRIKYLLDLWEKIILSISNQVDHNKILIFLQKVWVIDINEEKKRSCNMSSKWLSIIKNKKESFKTTQRSYTTML